jgi:hypothetical protein
MLLQTNTRSDMKAGRAQRGLHRRHMLRAHLQSVRELTLKGSIIIYIFVVTSELLLLYGMVCDCFDGL